MAIANTAGISKSTPIDPRVKLFGKFMSFLRERFVP